MSSHSWAVVLPVKGSAAAKSRLEPVLAPWRSDLASAFAADTVAAAAGARAVGRVVVVTDHAPPLPVGRRAAVELVADPARGMNAAVRAGIRWAAGAGHVRVAVLTADLPALRPDELDAALAVADHVPLGVVADAEYVGTTLLTATSPVLLEPRFGPGSYARHRAAGAVEIDATQWPGLRRDVDLPEHLAQARFLGLGRRTTEVVERIDRIA